MPVDAIELPVKMQLRKDKRKKPCPSRRPSVRRLNPEKRRVIKRTSVTCQWLPNSVT